MNGDLKRPDPDELLARLKHEEQAEAHGRLKIFLGYVAGVGKTYAMLEAAHQRLTEGIDVVVGFVETHARKETEALISGLPVIPRRTVEYHGTTLTEMDLDAVLARHPALVLVDELAHTNAPESRHPKRYLDVEEVLNAGIDVYTTINVQHLESLNDVVQQITGVVVHETIPDRVLDEATEIELVDLPADELLQRLKDGKVYVPEAAARALDQFFRKGNLTALRELSMRRAAERVDNQMVDYMQTKAIPGPWAAGERILVCLSSHPMGERLIRAGRRLADDLNGEWTVLYVETPGHLRMPHSSRERLEKNLRLAEDLGAKVVSTTDEAVASVVVKYAHAHNITKIIAGKPLRPRWYEVMRNPVIDQILRSSGNIDVYVITEDTPLSQGALPRRALPDELSLHSPISRYALSLLLVALVTLAGFPLRLFLDATNLVMLYLVGVLIAAVYLGRGPSILASIVSVLAFDYFFVNPRFSFSVTDTQYLLTFLGLLVVGLVISNSAAVLRDQVDVLRRREQQTQALNRLSGQLASAVKLEQVLETVIRNVGEMFGRETAILLPVEPANTEARQNRYPRQEENGSQNGPNQNNLQAARILAVQKNNLSHSVNGASVDPPVLPASSQRLGLAAASDGLHVNEIELAVADWAFKNGHQAGRGTDTLPAAEMRFIPLVASHGPVGVLGIRGLDPASFLSMEQRALMEGVANLSALAIERGMLAEKATQTEMLRQTERLQTALLNSISHELRTPLATITGVLSSLGESARTSPEQQLDADTSLDLIDSATRQARRLNRLVENLLDMSRLEAGVMRLNLEPGDLQDLIGAVLDQSQDRFCDHPIQVELSPGLVLVQMDAVLIGQVLDNILDNACKYSPSGSPIIVQAGLDGKQVVVEVKDAGIGIPPDDLERIFDKFYRVLQQPHSIAGTGLGLSICKGIIEAHGGTIWAANNPTGGVTLTFTLPVTK